MTYYLKISAIIIALVALFGAVQGLENRFCTFENYLNIGYGNVPYK